MQNDVKHVRDLVYRYREWCINGRFYLRNEQLPKIIEGGIDQPVMVYSKEKHIRRHKNDVRWKHIEVGVEMECV